MKIVLTDELIARLRPSEKNQPFYDGKQPGLVLRITPADNRSWFAVKRPPEGRDPLWKKFGEWPEMKTREARDAVLPALAQIGKTMPKSAKPGDEPWEVLAERYITYLHRLDRHGNPVVRSADESEAIIRRHLIEPWRGMPGRKITREVVVPVLKAHRRKRANPLDGQGQPRMIGGPFACRRLHGIAHAMFGWLADPNDPDSDMVIPAFISVNPVPSNGESIHGLRPEDCRRKVWLDRPSKLAAVWHAAGVMIDEGVPGGRLFGLLTRLAIAGGQRRSQFAKLRHDQVEGRTVWFGRDKMKENVEHVMPETTYINHELSSLPSFYGSPWYFTVHGRVPFNVFGYWHPRLRELSGVSDFTHHDLRRTMRSWLGMVRFPDGRRIDTDIRELIIAHARPGMEKVYDVTTALNFQPEMREALELWQAHLLRLPAPDDTEALEAWSADLQGLAE